MADEASGSLSQGEGRGKLQEEHVVLDSHLRRASGIDL